MTSNFKTDKVKQACVLGWPVEHSRSPLIHRSWLEQYGLEGSYIKCAVTPEDFPEFIKTFRQKGFIGASVTVPHKEAAFHLADHADSAAHAIGAANMLWFEEDKLVASNTDGYGFMAHLNEASPQWQMSPLPVVILGAGGAARAILHALLTAGVETISLYNRTSERAKKIADDFGNRISIGSWEERSAALKGAGLLVNTTTLGMIGNPPLEIDLGGMEPGGSVMDIVYAPLETPLLRQAKLTGLIAVDGLGMLLHQAVPAFEKWFGVRPQVSADLRELIVADLEKPPS